MELAIRRLILKRFRSVPTERLDFDNPTFLVLLVVAVGVDGDR